MWELETQHKKIRSHKFWHFLILIVKNLCYRCGKILVCTLICIIGLQKFRMEFSKAPCLHCVLTVFQTVVDNKNIKILEAPKSFHLSLILNYVSSKK